jgi:benzylsuccinate CoA-transferase BbsF subunit
MEKQALEGVKVLDFGWALVGSLASKHLADHGAQVVRVESITRLDLSRTIRMASISKVSNPDDKPWFTHLNTSKHSIVLNLKHPRAREVVDRLIRWADVVLENFTPGTMSKLGYDYEYIKKIKPDIIMISGSVYGQTGPLSLEWGVDGTGAALSGHTYLTGWPDRGPVIPCNVPYGDTLLPMIMALAVVTALDYKHRTGKGQYMDASMIEAIAHKNTPAVLDWQLNKELQARSGNRVPYAAPHGVFPCTGDDRWCAVAVLTDEEWEAFCHVIGDPPWTKEERFSSFKSRKENEDELEELIAQWTKGHSAEDVMLMMQTAGVPAGVVQNARDILEDDPQLKERGALVSLKHPVLGVFGHQSPPYKLLKTKAQVRTSPCLGEHTNYVCTQLLGMSDEEFNELLQQGVFK